MINLYHYSKLMDEYLPEYTNKFLSVTKEGTFLIKCNFLIDGEPYTISEVIPEMDFDDDYKVIYRLTILNEKINMKVNDEHCI